MILIPILKDQSDVGRMDCKGLRVKCYTISLFWIFTVGFLCLEVSSSFCHSHSSQFSLNFTYYSMAQDITWTWLIIIFLGSCPATFTCIIYQLEGCILVAMYLPALTEDCKICKRREHVYVFYFILSA